MYGTDYYYYYSRTWLHRKYCKDIESWYATECADSNSSSTRHLTPPTESEYDGCLKPSFNPCLAKTPYQKSPANSNTCTDIDRHLAYYDTWIKTIFVASFVSICTGKKSERTFADYSCRFRKWISVVRETELVGATYASCVVVRLSEVIPAESEMLEFEPPFLKFLQRRDTVWQLIIIGLDAIPEGSHLT